MATYNQKVNHYQRVLQQQFDAGKLTAEEYKDALKWNKSNGAPNLGICKINKPQFYLSQKEINRIQWKKKIKSMEE